MGRLRSEQGQLFYRFDLKSPDLRFNRLNLDTDACLGGRLTAAFFDDQKLPSMFINDLCELSWPVVQS
jgi:hypothetical protein